ncbi:MAG: DUF4252 domain-containing protein [Bacteroidota bacterium]
MSKRNLLLLLAALVGFATLKSQSTNAIDRYFQEYLDDERFSVVYVSPRVFQLLDRVELGEVETDDREAELVKDLATDLRGLRILTTNEDPRAFYAEAKKRIDTQDYELLMTVRRGNKSNVEFLIYEDENGVISELLMISGGEESFALLSFVGKINLNTVSELADEMGKNK